MPKVNMAYKFRTLEGKAIPRDTGKTKKVKKGDKEVKEPIYEDLKLKHICIDALLNPEVDEKGNPVNVVGTKKFDRWELAAKIHNSNGIIELSSDDKDLLKDLIGKGYSPIIVGQAWEALEGKRGLEAKETIPKKKPGKNKPPGEEG